MTPQQWDYLTTEDKKVAVAKMAGYLFRRHGGTQELWWREHRNDPNWKPIDELPDFLGDLHVMYKLEEQLDDDTYMDYVIYLQGQDPETYIASYGPVSYWDIFHAEADVKAMAFTLAMANNS
jgi:hypothetical protein